jgi:hypothetical protein
MLILWLREGDDPAATRRRTKRGVVNQLAAFAFGFDAKIRTRSSFSAVFIASIT